MNLNDILAGNTTTKRDKDVRVIDSDWVSSHFIVGNNTLSKLDQVNRFSTTAFLKFTNSSLGGNIGINPWPQITRFADAKPESRYNKERVTKRDKKVIFPTGRISSEMEDYRELVYMQFGVPRFNSLLDFLTHGVDYETSVIANTGRPATGYSLGKHLGGLTALAAFPMITIAVWAGSKIYNAFVTGTSFNYYYMEPTMHTYWGTVSQILNTIATEEGIMNPVLMESNTTPKTMGIPIHIDKEDIEDIKKILPGVISDGNYIDVFAIATRCQALANQRMLEEYDYFNKDGVDPIKNYQGYVSGLYTNPNWRKIDSIASHVNNTLTFSKYLKNIQDIGQFSTPGDADILKAEENPPVKTTSGNVGPDGQPVQVDDVAATSTMNDAMKKQRQFSKNNDGTIPYSRSDNEQDWLDKAITTVDSTVRQGGLYLAMYVNPTGSVSESFSNSVGSIGTNGMIKSVSSKVQNLKFDIAGGNIVAGMNEALGMVKNVLTGAADGFTLGLTSVISSIVGGSYFDIPLKWDDSEFNAASLSYSVDLVAPYGGNVFSRLQNIYIPLAAILAGAAPMATGKAGYSSPFLCSIFNKGKQDISLGMITQLTIERGIHNLSMNRQKKAMGFRISFTVTDFSKILAAPVNASVTSNFKLALEDDTPFGRYLATICSRDLLSSKYFIPKWKRKISKALLAYEQMVSPYSMGMRVGESLEKVLGGVVADHSIALSQSNRR